MNKIFKVIWNNAKHCYVVASELAKSYSKGRGSRTIRRAALAISIAAVFSATGSALAENSGGQLDVDGNYIGESPNYNVTITEPVTGDVYGRKEDSNTSEEATVNVSGGTIGYNDNGNIYGGNVYGGYVESGSGDAASNSVNISGGTVNSSVYGGNVVEGSGDAINNSVNISGGTMNDSVYGGFTDGSGDASNNSVTINGVTVNNVDTDWFELPAGSGNWVGKPKLTGGFSHSGAVIGNQVSITNAALGGNYPSVYGGYSRTGNVSKNVITVESENSNLYVYGGYSETGAVGGDTAADGNIVTVKSGEVNYVVGGFSTSQDVKNNKALIEGGTVGNFVAGGLSDGSTVSSNVVNISGSITTISGTGDHSGVYGGYVEQGSGNATSNSVTISGGTVNSSVYGGYSFSGDTTSNSVNISDGSIDTVYGGYVEQGSGNAASNSVNISGGTVNRNVYGGYSESGSSASNSVNISGESTSITEFVYGGYVNTGTCDVTCNTVNITDGTINSIFGGTVEEGSGNSASNSVNISGGRVLSTVAGGASYSGEAASNSVNISGGEINNVFGGYSIEGTTASNTVNIINGTVNSNVFGGYSTSADSSCNNVNISGGEINTVYGGYVNSGSGDSISNSVSISGGSMGNVIGGYSYKVKSASNSVNISGGSIKNVYGGYSHESNAVDNTTIISGDTTLISEEAYGGKSYSGNAESNSAIISGGNIKSATGGYSYLSDAASNSVYVSGGSITTVDGGFSYEGTVACNSVIISGGEINNVFGGYVHTGSGDSASNSVSISGDTTSIISDVCGGLSNTGKAVGNSVNIIGGTVGRGVYGGSSYISDSVSNSVSISGGTVGDKVYGGSSDTGDAISNSVNVSGGSMTSVFGGNSNSGNSLDNSIIISGGTISNYVYGGYVPTGSGDSIGNSVSISGDTTSIIGDVCGGLSPYGNVASNSVNISGGAIGRGVYGGSSKTGDSDSNSVIISGGTVEQVVYGGYSREGNSLGNSVNISGGSVNGYLYGGYVIEGSGNAASNSVTINSGTVIEHIYGGYVVKGSGDASCNSVTINGGTFSSEGNIYAGYVYEPNNSTISDNVVNLSGKVKELNNSEIYGYYFENGSGAHSGNELHIGRAVDYDGEGHIQRDSEGNIKYKSDSSTIWHGKSSDGTVNNSINKIANFDTIALHSVARDNDLPAIKAAAIENIGTVDVTDLKFYENGSEKTTFEFGDKMNLLTWENEKEALINLKYKLDGTGDEQTASFSDNPNGITIKTKSVSEADNGISFEGTNTGNINKVDKSLQFSFASIILNSVDISGWDGKNTSEVPSGWGSNDNCVNVSGVFAKPELSTGESKIILTASTDMFKDENIDEKIRYKNYSSFKDNSVNGISISGYLAGGVKASNGGKYLSYYAIKKTADKLTFGDVEWKDQGSLIDHKTMLKDISFDGADIDTTKIAFTNKEKLDANMKMTLVSDFGDSVGTITGTKYKVGTAYEGEGSAYLEGSDLVFKTKTGAGLSDETHTTVMAMEAGIAALAVGNDHIGSVMESLGMATNRGSDGVSTAASVGGGSSRYETGSHVDTSNWNIAVAVGKNLEKKDGTLEYGLFGEYGRGNYTLHMDGIADAGSGNTHYTGGGLLLKWTNSHDVYTEASFRMGSMKDKASSLLHDGNGNAYGYDTSAKYRGGHFGFGKTYKEEDNTKLDIYGKYFYNEREGINFAAGADQYSLDELRSRVLRAGFRLSSTDKKWNRYGGLSYDYEFGGESRGTVNGTAIRSASVKGGTLRGEFGYCREATKTNPWKTDISLYGFTGKRNGFGGSVAVEYHF